MGLRTTLAVAVLVLAAAYVLVPQMSGRSWDVILSDAEKSARELASSSVRPPQSTSSAGGKLPAPAAGAPPPPQLSVSLPITRPITDKIVATGRFEAVETVELRSRVAGYLNSVHFKDGQDVEKGQLLFVIDPRPFERALAQAKAELDQAKVRIANASLDVDRARTLVDRRIVSEKTFDDRENLVREAQAQARIAEERIKTAELELSYTRITAPVSGRIGRMLVTPGNYVSGAGVSTASTQALATIVVQDPIHLHFELTEAEALRFKRMSPSAGVANALAAARVDVELADEGDFKHRGTLDFIDNRLDAATASLRVRAVLDNKARLFTPGQFARARIEASEPYAAMLLPDSAIGSDQTNRFVIVLGPGDTAVRKTVTLGPLVDGLRVVRSASTVNASEALTSDDWVVTRGLTRARPGQKIIPIREPMQVSSGNPPAATTIAR